jgi:hypothetical protein
MMIEVIFPQFAPWIRVSCFGPALVGARGDNGDLSFWLVAGLYNSHFHDNPFSNGVIEAHFHLFPTSLT